jgi:tetratricopeptide (TPR) repeat protein
LVEGGKLAEAATAYQQYLAKAKPEEITGDFYAYVAEMHEAISTAATTPQEKRANDSLAVENYRKSLTLDRNVEVAAKVAETLFEKLKKYDESIVAYDTLKAIKGGKLGAKDLYNVGRAYYVERQFVEADTAFANLIVLQPKLIQAYSWRGKSEAALDSVAPLKFAAKPFFDKVIEIGAATPDKNKAEVINALEYLGYYYAEKDNAALAKQTFEKLKAVDPTNVKATEYLKAIQAAQKPKQKSGQK